MRQESKRNPLLADGMGSGKTCQSIIAYLLMAESGLVRNLLIVCPKSVLWTWVREFKKLLASEVELTACVYSGYSRKSIHISLYDIVIVTYETLRNDIERFKKIRWGMAIFDEIHNIRNHDARKSKAAKQLKADYYIGLSGTPIVNNIGDMHSIMEILNPSLLGSRSHFDNIYGAGVDNWGNKTRYKETPMVFEQINAKISPVMIRRDEKEIMKDIPPCHRLVRWVSLKDTKQGENYDKLLADKRLEYLDKESGEMTSIQTRASVLALLTRLKQQANIDFVTGQSAKIDTLEEMLRDEIFSKNGSKAVVFSQFHAPLDIMEKRFAKWNPLRIDGTVNEKLREDMCQKINDPSSPHRIMLCQIKSGGEGIDLPGADFAIIFDLWWNSAAHEQAFKRIRRLSQERRQHFIHIITENTIEDKIIGIIERKNKAFRGVVEGQLESSDFTTGEMREVLFDSGVTQ